MKNIKRIRAKGFTLIEIIVGMLITLIASLVIFQVLSISEGHKRSTTGGNDALQSGSYSTYMLHRIIQMGGSGFATVPSIMGCPLRVFYGGVQLTGSNSAYNTYPTPFKAIFNSAFASRSTAYSLPIAPALIIDGGTGSDTIVTFSGQHASLGTTLTPSSKDSTGMTLPSSTGLSAGDLLLLLDKDSSYTTNCDVVQVASVSGNYATITNSSGFTGPTGTADYSLSLIAAPLGKAPTITSAPSYPYPTLYAYAVGSDGQSSNALLVYDILRKEMRSMTDNIYSMKAIYGVAATSSNQAVSQWVDASTTGWSASTITAANIELIRAVRIGLVVRNNVKEKAKPTGLTSFTLFGDTSVSKTININTADQYYRFKTFDITIPLRNMVLMTKNPQS